MTMVLSLLLLSLSCKKDPDDLPQKYMMYSLLCPGGIRSCYAACGNRWDLNTNGNIDPVEQVDYDSCTGKCDTNCDTSFLLMLLNGNE
jgi:hypothetical protein